MVLRCLDLTGNRADVDDSPRPAKRILRRLLQHRQERSAHEPQWSDVSTINVVPILECSIFVIEQVLLHLFRRLSFPLERSHSDPGIVDEDVELLLLLTELIVQLRNLTLLAHVTGQRNDLTRDALAIRLSNSLEPKKISK